MERNRLLPPKRNGWNEEERLRLAALLIKAGFTVRIGKEKRGNATEYFIEYWEEKDV